MDGAFLGRVVMSFLTNGGRDLELELHLEAPVCDLWDQGACGGVLHALAQLTGDTMVEGQGS